jgi:GR25 family glycosyltransferase involved in LPS biosynthesis
MKYVTITLGKRFDILNRNIEIIPDMVILDAINGYDTNRTIDEFIKSKLKLVYLHFQTSGTLACWLSKYICLFYQIQNNIDYMCFMEDDILIKEGFKDHVESKISCLKDLNIIRFCDW